MTQRKYDKKIWIRKYKKKINLINVYVSKLIVSSFVFVSYGYYDICKWTNPFLRHEFDVDKENNRAKLRIVRFIWFVLGIIFEIWWGIYHGINFVNWQELDFH